MRTRKEVGNEGKTKDGNVLVVVVVVLNDLNENNLMRKEKTW